MQSRAEQARQLAHRNDRCGEISGDQICLRPSEHEGEHKYESINQVIPFVTK